MLVPEVERYHENLRSYILKALVFEIDIWSDQLLVFCYSAILPVGVFLVFTEQCYFPYCGNTESFQSMRLN